MRKEAFKICHFFCCAGLWDNGESGEDCSLGKSNNQQLFQKLAIITMNHHSVKDDFDYVANIT